MLNIITKEQESNEKRFFQQRSHRSVEMRARFERLWLLDPEQFNPLSNCMEKERLDRTERLIQHYVTLKDKMVCDIGCGTGIFAKRLRDGGAQVVAVDIAENALKHVRQGDCEHIETRQDAMPMTNLPDNGFDVMVCMDLIAELPKDDYRLFFSELARILKPTGYVVCSTPIDIDTEEGVHLFLDLVQTEFDVVDIVSSHHALYLKIKRLFAWKPIAKILKNNRRILLLLEKMCRFFWNDAGISHVIVICQRRPLQQ